MAEYIEREAIVNAFDRSISSLRAKAGENRLLQASIDFVQNSRDFVANVPAADVVEVRHGAWNVTENRQHLDVGCSICKSSFYVYKQGQYRIDRSNYCPVCGAKMDGKGEGE